MVSRGNGRFVLAPLGALLMSLTLAAGTALADEAACSASADPPSATGGSVFTFSGSGFQPTKLGLQKETDELIFHDLNVGTDDPWEVTVRSRAGDEGTWTASFSAEGGCTVDVEFRVTLSSTDLLESGPEGAPIGLLALYMFVVVGGFSGGVPVAWRIFGSQTHA